MKRVFSLLLCLCMAFALAAPALAEAPMDEALTEITVRVKELLEIDDEYTSFSGNWNDGLRPGWYLSWSDDGRDLSVTCDADGVVTEVYRWQNSRENTFFYGFDAAFPALSEAEAEAQAQGWLARLMGEGESARIDGHTVSLAADGAYRFTGTVLKNGLESPVTFSLRIDGGGLASYDRSDSMKDYVGRTPSPTPAVKAPEAAAALRQAETFELYYVTDGDEVRLRYVPVGPATVVDARSGESVDMDALYASFGGSARNGIEEPMAMESAAMDTGAGRALTAVELTSIENYAEALSREDLDRRMRGLGDLGLADFELSRCSYGMDADGNITADLRYTCEMTADNLFGYSMAAFWDFLDWGGTPTVTKYITADAKTGQLLSVSTSYPLWERDGGAYPAADAEGFLRACAPEMLAESALCTLRGYDGEERTYARMHDGYFFPENYLYVRMNDAAGTVDEYRFEWDGDAVFAPSAGIVDEAAATDAYIGALDLVLGYTAWPEGIDYDDPVLYRYADWGYTYVESLRLAYWYGGKNGVTGVDALTGRALTTSVDGAFRYDDLEGIPQRGAIEALGEAGIGFDGGGFRPSEAITMGDAASLLLRAAGYTLREWDDASVRDEALWLGFFSASDWEADRPLTRMEFIRAILDASKYGPAAALEGIWASGFRDVAPEDEGYAAIAGALGMAEGAKLRTDEICTRADAAQLLYDFMCR